MSLTPATYLSNMSLTPASNPKKRSREEGDDEVMQAQQAKRPHSLPFRTSPTIKHTRLFSQSKRSRPKPLFTQTLTPADSEDEISPPFSSMQSTSAQIYATTPEQSSNPQSLNVAEDVIDMDMVDAMMLSPRKWEHEDMSMISPGASPRTLLPQQADAVALDLDSLNTGRLPTPIYGHFQQPAQPPTSSGMVAETAETVQPWSEKEVENERFLRSRRLPSPISEDEAMDFPSAPNTSPMETQTHFPDPPRGLRTPSRLAQPLTGQSPQRGKIMFSMGFKADCEMCRNRVPGHSNHIYRV